MKKFLAFALTMGLLLTLGGCASSVMTKAPSPELKPPPAGMAQIVFMRDSFVASAIGCDLLQVENGGKLKFIGVVANATKIAYLTPPGHKSSWPTVRPLTSWKPTWSPAKPIL
jgi:hypothetical protein